MTDYSSFKLQDKIAIVTGPSQGIGRAVAIGLAQAGAHLVLAGRPDHQEALKPVQAEIEALGRKTLIVPTDVADINRIRAMIDKAKAIFGRIDILVNNASWTCTGPALNATEEDYDSTMDTNVKNVFFACQAVAKVMIPQGGGRIINIGSNFAITAFKTRAIYAAAKAAVHQLSRALSLEWAKQGVIVNVVAPCITETVSRKPILEKPGYKEWATGEKLASGRWNQPEDIVGAVLFLASPNLSAQVVGHVLMVDGGWTIT
ncbi:MAG TPA: SDR family oxidoreductase [Gemmataceae bacterium]|nr:SDR family oxidoreductase [Gemmataceae bacterium]